MDESVAQETGLLAELIVVSLHLKVKYQAIYITHCRDVDGYSIYCLLSLNYTHYEIVGHYPLVENVVVDLKTTFPSISRFLKLC